MGRCVPRSQTRALMAEKEQIALRLLQRGLTISQIAGQLRCSPFFVRKVRSEMLSAKADPGG
jgi:DNA-binding NarL/FixJ family response regulator